jgi:putative transcriptional regulator
MTPQHHPEPDELIAYASGTSPEWVSLVVACHLTYCAECRDEVSLLNDLGGALLAEAPREGTLDLPALDDAARAAARPRAEPIPEADALGIPRCVQPYLKGGARLRYLAPGLRQIPLALDVGEVPARIIRFMGGFTVPKHSHEGLEMLVVLDGVLEDSTTGEVFRTGDVSRREPGTTHRQHIPWKAGPCTCLVISEKPVTAATPWGKLLKWVTGV